MASRAIGFDVGSLLRSYGEQMRASLTENLVPHAGELGADREEVVREFFRKYLQPRFGVSTGFVFDSEGNVSQQVDVIIFDAGAAPRFETVGGRMFFPCECVVSVGQVKSVLGSKHETRGALDNLRSVKVLNRGAGGESQSLRDGHFLDPVTNHLDQIFTFLIITGRVLKMDTMQACLSEYLRDNPRHLWPNACLAFDKYLLSYFCDDGVCPNPLHALGFSASTEECSKEELLLRFYTMVARATAATHVSAFPYWDTSKPKKGGAWFFSHFCPSRRNHDACSRPACRSRCLDLDRQARAGRRPARAWPDDHCSRYSAAPCCGACYGLVRRSVRLACSWGDAEFD